MSWDSGLRRWRNLDQHTKFGNTPQRCRANILHHSKLEARRCDELAILELAGEISGLQAHPQPQYSLDVNGVHICDVRPDFEYVDRDGNLITEDTKGVQTEVSKLKFRLFEALHGRPIQIVRGRKR